MHLAVRYCIWLAHSLCLLLCFIRREHYCGLCETMSWSWALSGLHQQYMHMLGSRWFLSLHRSPLYAWVFEYVFGDFGILTVHLSIDEKIFRSLWKNVRSLERCGTVIYIKPIVAQWDEQKMSMDLICFCFTALHIQLCTCDGYKLSIH